MAIPTPDAVLSHWYNLLEQFSMSSLDFYSSIEDCLKRREVPNIKTSRIDWSESGVFSAKREYLRVERGPYVFDVCGAPFGTGFFISYWLVRPQLTPWIVTLFLLMLSAGFVLMACTLVLGFLGPFIFPFAYPVLFWIFVQMMNNSREGWDDSIVAIPILGAIYERIFRPVTYYRIDTALMFQTAVHNAVLEAIDRVTEGKGVRALSELEKRPVMMSLGKGAGS